MIYARLHLSRWSPRSPLLPRNFWLGTWSRPPDRPSQVALGVAAALLVVALVPGGPRWLVSMLEVTGAGELRRRRRFLFVAVVRRGVSLARLHRVLPSRRTAGTGGGDVLAAGPRALARPPRLDRARPDRELPREEPAAHRRPIGSRASSRPATRCCSAPRSCSARRCSSGRCSPRPSCRPPGCSRASSPPAPAKTTRAPSGSGASRRSSRSSRAALRYHTAESLPQGAAAAALDRRARERAARREGRASRASSPPRASRSGSCSRRSRCRRSVRRLLAWSCAGARSRPRRASELAIRERRAPRLDVRGGAARARAAARREPRRRGPRLRARPPRTTRRGSARPLARRRGRRPPRWPRFVAVRANLADVANFEPIALLPLLLAAARPAPARRARGCWPPRGSSRSRSPRAARRCGRRHVPRRRRERAGRRAARGARAHRAGARARRSSRLARIGRGRDASRSRWRASRSTPRTSTRGWPAQGSAARTTSPTSRARRARRTGLLFFDDDEGYELAHDPGATREPRPGGRAHARR